MVNSLGAFRSTLHKAAVKKCGTSFVAWMASRQPWKCGISQTDVVEFIGESDRDVCRSCPCSCHIGMSVDVDQELNKIFRDDITNKDIFNSMMFPWSPLHPILLRGNSILSLIWRVTVLHRPCCYIGNQIPWQARSYTVALFFLFQCFTYWGICTQHDFQ